jgi:uncharacterized ferritin-like protein (DUF455 family)
VIQGSDQTPSINEWAHGGVEAVAACLAECDPDEKWRAVHRLVEAVGKGAITLSGAQSCKPLASPGRPERPPLVAPERVPRRRLGNASGRAALVHAIAHIEFNAINLTLDAVCRFAGMPDEYYRDWISVAEDEARHFSMLSKRLSQLGHQYGDFEAHNGLWEMAEKTAGSCLERMALVPRVLEARGLDVTPGMIQRLEQAGDADTVAVLHVILAEEIRHVDIGSHWFRYCCDLEGVNPEKTFFELLGQHFGSQLRGPFNLEARQRAGFTDSELKRLIEPR